MCSKDEISKVISRGVELRKSEIRLKSDNFFVMKIISGPLYRFVHPCYIHLAVLRTGFALSNSDKTVMLLTIIEEEGKVKGRDGAVLGDVVTGDCTP